MSTHSPSQFVNRVVVAAVEHDRTRLYLLHGDSSVPTIIERPESTLMHVRAGQERNLHSLEAKESEYFSTIAHELESASRVVLFGHGAGRANTMESFVKYLGTHHRQIRDKCLRGDRVDFSAVTDGELLALARKLWEHQ